MKNIKKIYNYTDYKGRFQILYKNEKGSALLIAMIMMVVLTVIGATTMNTATTEVIISGNYRTMKECFYNTEGPIEYAIKQSDIYKAIESNIGSSVDIPLGADNISSAALGINIFTNVTTGTVTYIRDGNALTGSGSSGRARYYRIDVAGSGPTNASCHHIVEKTIPKPEES